MMQVVSFGDRPPAIIAQLALQKTANLAGAEYRNEKEVIHSSTCVDDIIDSVESKDEVLKMTNNITLLILALVIGLTGHSIYQMYSDLHDLKQDIMSVGD